MKKNILLLLTLSLLSSASWGMETGLNSSILTGEINTTADSINKEVQTVLQGSEGIVSAIENLTALDFSQSDAKQKQKLNLVTHIILTGSLPNMYKNLDQNGVIGGYRMENYSRESLDRLHLVQVIKNLATAYGDDLLTAIEEVRNQNSTHEFTQRQAPAVYTYGTLALNLNQGTSLEQGLQAIYNRENQNTLLMAQEKAQALATATETITDVLRGAKEITPRGPITLPIQKDPEAPEGRNSPIEQVDNQKDANQANLDNTTNDQPKGSVSGANQNTESTDLFQTNNEIINDNAVDSNNTDLEKAQTTQTLGNSDPQVNFNSNSNSNADNNEKNNGVGDSDKPIDSTSSTINNQTVALENGTQTGPNYTTNNNKEEKQETGSPKDQNQDARSPSYSENMVDLEEEKETEETKEEIKEEEQTQKNQNSTLTSNNQSKVQQQNTNSNSTGNTPTRNNAGQPKNNKSNSASQGAIEAAKEKAKRFLVSWWGQ